MFSLYYACFSTLVLRFHSYGATLLMSLRCWEGSAEGVWMDCALGYLMIRLQVEKSLHLVKKHKRTRQSIDDWGAGHSGLSAWHNWSFVARAEWGLMYVHGGAPGMKAP